MLVCFHDQVIGRLNVGAGKSGVVHLSLMFAPLAPPIFSSASPHDRIELEDFDRIDLKLNTRVLVMNIPEEEIVNFQAKNSSANFQNGAGDLSLVRHRAMEHGLDPQCKTFAINRDPSRMTYRVSMAVIKVQENQIEDLFDHPEFEPFERDAPDHLAPKEAIPSTHFLYSNPSTANALHYNEHMRQTAMNLGSVLRNPMPFTTS